MSNVNDTFQQDVQHDHILLENGAISRIDGGFALLNRRGEWEYLYLSENPELEDLWIAGHGWNLSAVKFLLDDCGHWLDEFDRRRFLPSSGVI